MNSKTRQALKNAGSSFVALLGFLKEHIRKHGLFVEKKARRSFRYWKDSNIVKMVKLTLLSHAKYLSPNSNKQQPQPTFESPTFEVQTAMPRKGSYCGFEIKAHR